MPPTLSLITAAGLALAAGALAAQPAIGEWRDHFQYRSTVAVVQGNAHMYCATSTALFKYDQQTGETVRYNKVNALNDVNIQALGWNTARNTLVVGYRNGNLDLVGPAGTVNLPDIKRSSIVGDKGIYSVANEGELAYLGCGFGIVVVDLARREVKDTWLIGPNAAQMQVHGIAFHQDSIYAATQAGVFAAWKGEPNLAAYTNWHQRTDLPGHNGAFNAIVPFNGTLVVNRRLSTDETDELDTLYYFDAGWQVLTAAGHDQNRSVRASSDGQRLTVTGRNRVREFDTAWAEVYYADHLNGAPLRPRDAVHRDQGGIWIATDGHGLVQFHSANNFGSFFPNGPHNNSVYRMSAAQGAVYATTGGPSGNWGHQYRKDGVHCFVDGRWQTAHRDNDPLFDTGGNDYAGGLNDVMAVQVDPDDGNHAFIGSWDDGVLEMRDGHATGFFDASNTTLQRYQNSADNGMPTQVGGLAYDERGNLWASNSHCAKPIAVRMRNGDWHSFSMGNVLGNNSLLSDIIVGRNGHLWAIRPRSSGMLVFSNGGTPAETGDDQALALNTYEGQGHLPSMDVFSLAEDHDQQIWVGTGKGVAVFYNPDAVFSGSNADAQQILIEQDGNVQILLETESVSAILVDGANRKWLGTQTSGLFLVSPDGTEQIAHFTAANSPLPSDNIICLAMDGATGELFIGTDQGIISYRGSATEGSLTAECISVFPNPVRESFTGPVAITGLARGSDVRITDMAGNLVYRTASLGGQAIWPATDMGGQRVATGVYLVLSVDPEGKNNCNTKVAVVR